MADCQLHGSCWISLTNIVRMKLGDNNFYVPTTMKNVNMIYDKQDISVYTICSVDIECISMDNTFPVPEKDSIVQIALVFAHQNIVSGKLDVDKRIIISLGECDKPISSLIDVTCIECHDETQLLLEFVRLIKTHDPDIITGYNINQFDLPYIHGRMCALKISPNCMRMLSRTDSPFNVDRVMRNGLFGQQQLTYICNMPGRVLFDMYIFIRKEFKFSCYKLDSVAHVLLNDNKINVHYSEIKKLCESKSGRRRVAEYCIKDAELPIRLVEKTKGIISYIEMSRALKVTLQNVIDQEQQYKLYSTILHETIARNTLIPSQYTVRNIIGIDEIESYRGAIVQEPVCGFYKDPVFVFDFASLYPSIMRQGNMCYSTHVSKNYLNAHSEKFAISDCTVPDTDSSLCGNHTKINVKRTRIDNGDGNVTYTYFVTHKHCDGILPYLLKSFIELRKSCRMRIKSETDNFMKSILDRRQLALKICANAIYGFTGVRPAISWLPCVDIAMTVTADGRDIIMKTVRHVIDKYNCNVIYGDTDSIMCCFQNISSTLRDDMFATASDMENDITSIFNGYIRIEFECIYKPFLLVRKKRYAGLLLGTSDNKDKVVIKGLETQRRDNFPLLRTTIDRVLRMFLMDPDTTTERVTEYINLVLSKIKNNEFPVYDFVITKELKKLNLQPHVVVAKKIETREPGMGPKLGDRVSYVITDIIPDGLNKTCGISHRAEDPEHVAENNLQIFHSYYINKIKNRIEKTFGNILLK